ncbi:hypothetical protein [Vulcanisaeta sp. JCM 14467]|uniref:hypothetical protein n=1 Tax=Vulcanisaeta sp. JCM 14467 TaxID=1295370 RepID=UPI002092D774|nr:hypothetical protein [Vulcanisaeta sp. JCM 14467]
MGISIITVLMLISVNTLAQPLNPKPILTINTNTYQINYYNITGIRKPTLIIHGYLNNNPVPMTVSLFALGEGHIYTVGYYYGLGSVNISLTAKPMMNIARETIRTMVLNRNLPDTVWPSILAFITYFDKSTNETRTVVVAIPYNPTWIASNASITISLTIDFSKVTPAKIVFSHNATNDTSISAANSSMDPYGFVGPYNCLGSINVLNAAPPLTNAGTGIVYWEPRACAGFNGSIPILWIAWGEDAWSNNIGGGIVLSIGGYAQKGSGLYGVANVPGSGLEVVGPTLQFSSSLPIYGGYNGYSYVDNVYAYFVFSSSPSLSYSYPNLYYYVNRGPGFLYLGINGTLALIQFEAYYVDENGYTWPLDEYANATAVINLLPGAIYNNALWLWPGIDLGNGIMSFIMSQTAPKFGLINPSYVYDYVFISRDSNGNYHYSGLCTSSPSITCTSSGCYFSLSVAASTFNPNPYGIAAEVGLFVAGLILAYPTVGSSIAAIFGGNEFLAGLATSVVLGIAGLMVPPPGSSSFFYFNTVINLIANPVSAYYVAFYGTPIKYSYGSVSSEAFPVGIIINSTQPTWETSTAISRAKLSSISSDIAYIPVKII